MLDLETLQDRMAAAIWSGDTSSVASEFSHAERLSIFRNNTFASLTEALKTTFPVTVQLADQRFFAYTAHEFIATHPAREARLSEYGTEFPRFLATFAPSRPYPIIAEMAAFEWIIASSLNDVELAALPFTTIGVAAIEASTRFWLQPNLRFGVSRLPLVEIWTKHKRGSDCSVVPLLRKPHRIAVWRTGEDLKLLELDSGQFVFWRDLAKGRSIEVAATRALSREPLFDLVHETLLIFRSSLVTGLSPPPAQHTKGLLL